VVILGILCVGMVFVVDRLGDIFQLSHATFGITAGTLLGLFSLGMLVPWATTKGAVVGGLISIVTMIWIIIGTQWHKMNHRVYHESLPSTTDGCLNLSSLFNHTIATTQNLTQVEPVDGPFFIYRISFMYYTLLGVLIVIVVGTIVSFICGASDLSEVDRDHFPLCITRCVRILRYNFEIYRKFFKYIGYIKNTKIFLYNHLIGIYHYKKYFVHSDSLCIYVLELRKVDKVKKN